MINNVRTREISLLGARYLYSTDAFCIEIQAVEKVICFHEPLLYETKAKK